MNRYSLTAIDEFTVFFEIFINFFIFFCDWFEKYSFFSRQRQMKRIFLRLNCPHFALLLQLQNGHPTEAPLVRQKSVGFDHQERLF
jgi:hypothetical protein